MGCSPYDVLQYCKSVNEYRSDKGVMYRGSIGSYSLNVSERGIYMQGGLASQHLPSNAYTLTRQGVGEAIEEISDLLQVDIGRAEVKRFEVSAVIPTKHPVSAYMPMLLSKPHYKRNTYGTSVTFATQKRELTFYDKAAEAVAKGKAIPPALQGKHLLRYEVRFKHRVKQQFKHSEPIRARELSEPTMYRAIVQQWQTEFESIKKQQNTLAMIKDIKTPKDIVKAFVAQHLAGMDANAIDEFMATVKGYNVIKDPKYYTRAKEMITEYLSAGTEKNELVGELEKAVNEIANKAMTE